MGASLHVILGIRNKFESIWITFDSKLNDSILYDLPPKHLYFLVFVAWLLKDHNRGEGVGTLAVQLFPHYAWGVAACVGA